jgi:hypothetical protein
LGRAADGHFELIEEANAAEHHQPIAVPAVLHEADPGPPLAIPVLLGVRSVQTYVDRLVAGPHHTASGQVIAFALIVLEIDPQLPGEQGTHERQIGATSHETGQPRRPAISIHQRDRKQWPQHQLTVPAELGVLPIGYSQVGRSVRIGSV